MKKIILLAFAVLVTDMAYASSGERSQVLLYDSTVRRPVDAKYKTSGSSNLEKPRAVEANIFEKTVKDAIETFENSMRGTCAKEMETSISVTAEGKWAVVGVSITGAMKLIILNPDMRKGCSK